MSVPFRVDSLEVVTPNGIDVGGSKPVIPSNGFGALLDGDAIYFDSSLGDNSPWVPEIRQAQTPAYAAGMSVNFLASTEVFISCTGNLTTWTFSPGRYAGQRVQVILERQGAVTVTPPVNTIWPLGARNAQDGSYASLSPFVLSPTGGNGDRTWLSFEWSITQAKWILRDALMENAA